MLLKSAKCIFIVLLVFSLFKNVFPQNSISDLQSGKLAYQKGEYLQTRSILKPLLNSVSGNDREVLMYYFKTYLLTGDYSRGVSEVDEYLKTSPNDPYLLNMKGKLLQMNGGYEEAENLYKLSRTSKNDYWENLLDLAKLYDLTGRKYQSASLYNTLYRQYTNQNFRTANTLKLAGYAAAKIGEFHDANAALRTAYRLDNNDVDVMIQWANLFLEKYNNADAVRTFNDALKVNQRRSDIYVGLGKSSYSFAKKEELAKKALSINPNDVDAMGVLAELMILDSNYESAKDLMQNALTVNPSSNTALANLASIYYLQEDSVNFKKIEEKAITINRLNSEFYILVSENLVKRFRYKAAVEMGYNAVSRDRTDSNAYSVLGTNLLRLGKIEDAYDYLKRGFDRDPFNLFAGNSLNLMDGYDEFDSFESEHFTLLIHEKESGVLADRILKYAEASYDSLSVRYPYIPSQKIRIEAYNDADDFAVRLSGLPGAPLLGVCFGEVLAFTTPEAQDGTPYNWSRTLWHEIAHVMALGTSDHRVPRWFTEGLSVHEEKKAKPEWAREMDIELLTAFEQDLLLPLEKFNEGFTRPKYQLQIILSYYQASKVIGLIEEEYGFKAIADLLVQFKEKNDLETSFMNVLGVSPSVIDRKFFDFLKAEHTRLKPVLDGMPNMLGTEIPSHSFLDKLTGKTSSPFIENLREGHEILKNDGDLDKAEKKFLDAIDLFPNFIKTGNPYEGLAEIYRKRSNENKLVEILEKYLTITEYGSVESIVLAEIYKERKDLDNAVKYYERALETKPYEKTTHKNLAEIYDSQGDFANSVVERRVLVSLNPLDITNARFDLAMALFKVKDYKKAKREVLKTLEIAPGFREAQNLLLEINKITKKEDKGN